MKRRFALSAFAALALTALSSLAVHAQTSYSYRDLGTLGGTFSSAGAVNNSGQVAGSASLANGATHPFFWSQATGMVDLGTFGGTGGSANGINAGGDVVGQATTTAGVWRAFFWNSTARVLTDLNSLLSPADAANWTLTYAWKINDNRQIIGQGTVTVGGAASTHGYLFDLTLGVLTDLGTIGPDSINNLASPQVAGWVSGNAYLYSGGSLFSLSPLVRARGINNAGETVGYLSNAHAAYRSPSGIITDLGEWAGLASGYSINNASPAMVVGDSNYLKGNLLIHHAFRWVVGSGAMQDLNTLTSGLGKKNPWILIFATGVSDTGYIVCQADPAGYQTTNQHGFLLTPNP